MVRIRTRETPGYGGSCQRTLFGNQTVFTGSPYIRTQSRCEDEVGSKGKDNILLINKIRTDSKPMNGFLPTGANSNISYSNWDPYFRISPPAAISITTPTDGAIMASAMARSNPSRAIVSIPTFVGEMKDLPQLVRSLGHIALRTLGRGSRRGRRLVREAGHDYLTWQFGLAPIISDIRKMVNFQHYVKRRVAELDRLYSKGGLKRRVTVVNEKRSDEQTIILSSEIGLINARRFRSTSVNCWATMRWKPVGRPSFNTDAEKLALASRLVLGLNAQSLTATAWELLPWSWMIDWFVGAQNLIEANNNAVATTCESRCVMRHTRTESQYTLINPPSWISGGDATQLRETKQRLVGVGASLNASLPLFSGSQLAILGALAATRLGR